MLRLTMLVLVLAAASVAVSSPSDSLKGKLQSAIWADLQLNAMIGNGAWIASLWYRGGSETAPNLHIQDLACSKSGSEQQCSFNLYRDGGPVTVLGESAPDRLACDAAFASDAGGWHIVHTPPHGAGHSKTSLRCKAITSYTSAFGPP